jgi:hypothetical protein
MRCSPEKSRPTITGECGGWLLPAAVRSIRKRTSEGSLWRASGEKNKNFLEEGNCGDLLILALTDTDTVGSIGSSRRGYLLGIILRYKSGSLGVVYPMLSRPAFTPSEPLRFSFYTAGSRTTVTEGQYMGKSSMFVL